MTIIRKKQDVQKDAILEALHEEKVSPLRKYQNFFLGTTDIGTLLRFELLTMLLGPMPGALGLLLRKVFYPGLFKGVGSDVLWGRNVALRHAKRIDIGHRVALDDNCILDAKGGGNGGMEIGNDVLIARDTIIQAKCSPVKIGNRCIIGSQCQLSSAGGIQLGDCVMLAGQCYIGGGRYHTEEKNTPMMDQGLYSKGPIVIEDDVWLGAGVIVLDGVRIGRGSLVGAGAVIMEDVGEFTVVTPHQKLVKLPRGGA